jgi:TRAP-type C4-dicarboxylate transport system permease small subunit
VFKTIENIFVKLVQFLLFLIFAVMTILVLAQVAVRFIGSNAINMAWSEELTRYLLCYLTFFGSAYLYEQRGHVAVTNLVNAVPAAAKRIMLILSYIVQLAFFIAIFVGSSTFLPVVATQYSSVMHIPMNIVYIGIPVTGACCLVFCIRDIVKLLQGSEDI